jgi:hypothetical protein
MLAKLVRGIDPLRYRNMVVSLTTRGMLAESIEAAGVPVHCLNMKRGRIDFLALLKLARMLREIRPTILQTWLYHADLLGTAASIFGGHPPLVWNLRCSDMDLAYYPATTCLTLRILAFCSRVPQVVIVDSQLRQPIVAAGRGKFLRMAVGGGWFRLEMLTLFRTRLSSLLRADSISRHYH